MIRQSIESRLRAAVANPPVLIADDFSITTEKAKWSVTVLIRFLGGDGESFEADLPNTKTERERGQPEFQIACKFNPGELTADERVTVWGIGALEQAIVKWSARIAEDLQHAPTFRAIRNQQTQIDEL